MEISDLIKCATNSKRKDKKDEKKFLAQITHLSLDKRQIQLIENLEFCPCLTVLYLNDNYISKLEGFDKLTKLIQLSLQDNKIFRIEGLESLVNLKKLYLEKNCIMGLRILDLQQCNVADAGPLYFLENITSLNLRDNNIFDIEGVVQFLRTSNSLSDLDLRGNPVQRVPKYRDQMIMLGLRLITLDDKKIMDQERRYLYNLVQQKEIKAEKQTMQMIKRQNSTSKLDTDINPGSSHFNPHSVTAPNFSQKRQASLIKPGNMSQQNQNPFGVTNRGYKGQAMKANGIKPPLSNMLNQQAGNKVIKQAGLSILGNQMTLGSNMYDPNHQNNQNYNDLNQDMIGGGSYSGKYSGQKKQHSININSGTDFSMGTQYANTKIIPRQNY
eukprot:403359455